MACPCASACTGGCPAAWLVISVGAGAVTASGVRRLAGAVASGRADRLVPVAGSQHETYICLVSSQMQRAVCPAPETALMQRQICLYGQMGY